MPIVLGTDLTPGSGQPLYLIEEQGLRTVKRHLSGPEWAGYVAAGVSARIASAAVINAIPDATAATPGGGSVDLTPVLTALNGVKTELDKLDALAKHLGVGTP